MATPEISIVDKSLWDEINWESVYHNKITKEEFHALKARNQKLYATFLGPDNDLQFFMYKPLSWGRYKEILEKKLSKEAVQDFVLTSCMVSPKLDPVSLNNMDAGVAKTLVTQVMTVSNFMKDLKTILENIIEVK